MEGDMTGTPSCVLGTQVRCPQLQQLWQLGERVGWGERCAMTQRDRLAGPSLLGRALRRRRAVGGTWEPARRNRPT